MSAYKNAKLGVFLPLVSNVWFHLAVLIVVFLLSYGLAEIPRIFQVNYLFYHFALCWFMAFMMLWIIVYLIMLNIESSNRKMIDWGAKRMSDWKKT